MCSVMKKWHLISGFAIYILLGSCSPAAVSSQSSSQIQSTSFARNQAPYVSLQAFLKGFGTLYIPCDKVTATRIPAPR